MTDESRSRNRRTGLIAAAVAATMVGASFAAVPLYRAFCQATGWGGTTQRAPAAGETIDRRITVRFDASVARGLPWRFKPEQLSQDLRVGEAALAFYKAENLSDRPVTGRATFNVQPAKAGIYFKKIECFCFTEQRLEGRQSVSMPVTFFIDPAIADDPDLDDVTTVTLAYIFFRSGEPAAASGAR